MMLDDIRRRIAARAPELSDADLASLGDAASDTEMVPVEVLELIVEVIDGLEARLDGLEAVAVTIPQPL